MVQQNGDVKFTHEQQEYTFPAGSFQPWTSILSAQTQITTSFILDSINKNGGEFTVLAGTEQLICFKPYPLGVPFPSYSILNI